MPDSTALPGPHEVFEQMRRHWLGETDVELLADDAVIELPFALPGRRTRFEGREDFRGATDAERANFPVWFEEVRNVVIHDTADPEVIVVEYELAGVVTTTGHRASARSSASCASATARRCCGANTRTPWPFRGPGPAPRPVRRVRPAVTHPRTCRRPAPR